MVFKGSTRDFQSFGGSSNLSTRSLNQSKMIIAGGKVGILTCLISRYKVSSILTSATTIWPFGVVVARMLVKHLGRFQIPQRPPYFSDTGRVC